MKLSKIIDILKAPKEIPIKINYRYPQLLKWMSDEQCVKFWYKYRFGKKLDLDNTITFNEKLQWLKLYDRKDIYTTMVDKYEVKLYVSKIIGNQYIIPTLGVWDSFEDIDFNMLPNQFVLKCTHDSGGLIICREKSMFNKDAACKRIMRSLKRNFYWVGREWPYKDVKPRIIAEKYMEESNINGLRDYKFYVFGGKVKYLYVSQGLENHSTAKISFLTPEWNLAPFRRSDYEQFEVLPPKPVKLNEMILIAEKLAANSAFRRVDLYEINDRIYFSELTFFPCDGFMPFEPEEWDIKLGDMLILPELK